MKAEQKQRKLKRGPIKRIFRGVGLGILALLLILALIFQAPWKITTLLAIILAACTVLPKRARKWFWLSTAALILILIIWVFLPEDDTGWRPYTVGEELVALAAKYAVPDEENAALIYEEIFENLDTDSNEPEFFMRSEPSSIDEPWLSKDRPEMIEWLCGYQDIIQKLIQNSQRQKCGFVRFTSGTVSHEELMATLPALRRSVYLLISAANNDAVEGRTDTALEKYHCAFRIANHLYQQPTFISVLVHCAIKEKTLIPLSHVIMERKPNSEQLKLIANMIDGVENNWSSDWRSMLDFDNLQAKNYFAGLVYEVDTAGKARFSRQPFFKKEQSSLNAPNKTYRSGVLGKMRAILRWTCFPSSPKAIAEVVDAAFEKHYTMGRLDFDWNQVGNFYTYWNLNYRSIIRAHLNSNAPGYKQVHETYSEYLSLCRGSRVLVAIRQYYDENNSWPESLDVIESSVPAEALMDPAGGRFDYENHGERFSLYGKLINVWPQ